MPANEIKPMVRPVQIRFTDVRGDGRSEDFCATESGVNDKDLTTNSKLNTVTLTMSMS